MQLRNIPTLKQSSGKEWVDFLIGLRLAMQIIVELILLYVVLMS